MVWQFPLLLVMSDGQDYKRCNDHNIHYANCQCFLLIVINPLLKVFETHTIGFFGKGNLKSFKNHACVRLSIVLFAFFFKFNYLTKDGCSLCLL